MAGIGFQLKALFQEKSLYNKVKAYVYSSLVASGPWIAAVVTVNVLLFISRIYINTFEAQSIFLGTIVYTFVFSQILTAPWQMLITRYYSDHLFNREYSAIRPGFIGLNVIIFFLSFVFSVSFYFNKPLPLYYKILAVYLFVILSLIWILMVSISSIKDYSIIAKAYIWGGGISVILTVVLLNNPIFFHKYMFQTNIILAYLVGLSITYMILLYSFLKVFNKGNREIFNFLSYLTYFPSLFYIGFFYTLGLWIDDLLMWISILSVDIVKTFRYAPLYDNAVFLAYLTIIPSTVMFMVMIETKLYDHYKKYYNMVNNEGTFEEIEVQKEDLVKNIMYKLFHSFQFQFLITITVVFFSKKIFEYLNLSIIIRDIFRVVAFGALFNIFILHIILIFLYFEKRKKALFISVSFCVSNAILTAFFIRFPIQYYGFGFTLSSIGTFFMAVLTLKNSFENLTRDTFLTQPLAIREKVGLFVLLSRILRVYGYTKRHRKNYKKK